MITPPPSTSVFITGSHRSGTSWIGHLLHNPAKTSLRDEEIFSPKGNKLCPHALLPWYWHYYICKDNEARFRDHIDALVNNRFSLLKALPHIKTREDILIAQKKFIRSLQRRLSPKMCQLFIEPLGIFSSEWFASRYNTKVLISVRHPASFISSLMRLGWTYDFAECLRQPELMRDHLEPFRHELESPPPDKDILGQGILLWKMFYSVVATFQKRHPDWKILCLENINRAPLAECALLYQWLNLEFTEEAKKNILARSQEGNPVAAPVEGGDTHARDSKKMITIWKERLEPEEIKRIRNSLEEVASPWYGANDW